MGGAVFAVQRICDVAGNNETALPQPRIRAGTVYAAHAGKVFTREQLLETVWGYDYEGGTRTVDVHVQTLRTKLGESGRFIETVRGVGYRFGE